MRREWVLAGVMIAACSDQSRHVPIPPDYDTRPGPELIPAEWTIAEDTSGTGEITTISVQLPTARDIAGLLQDDPPRLVLRCLEGRVAAFIDTEPFDGAVVDSAAGATAVPIELDAAPPCE